MVNVVTLRTEESIFKMAGCRLYRSLYHGAKQAPQVVLTRQVRSDIRQAGGFLTGKRKKIPGVSVDLTCDLTGAPLGAV